MKISKNLYTIHKIFTALMFAAFAMGAIFFVSNNLDFLIYAITFGKATFPNVMYWLSKCVGTMLIPLAFLLPSIPHFERIKLIKASFIFYGLIHILSVSWVFYYAYLNGFDGLLSNDAVTVFQGSAAHPFIHSFIYWGSFSWPANIASILFGLLCIYTGFNFDDTKKKVCILVILITALRVLIPAVFVIMSRSSNILTFWITNNYADIASFVAISAALLLASKLDSTWVSLIWDHEIQQNDDM